MSTLHITTVDTLITGRNKGFTLVEAIIVVVIIGVMAAVAIPRLGGQQEVGRAGEAVPILAALHAAQLRYCLDHACGAGTYPTVCTDYDVDVPALRNFNTPPTCANDGTISLTRSVAGGYVISVSAAGAYTCPACPANVDRILP